MEPLPCILTVAGSDSGGGAGIQADLKTITVLGGYGASVITALTAQNTLGVSGIEAVTPSFVAQQLATVLDDIPVAAAKTGMLFSAEIIEAVAPLLAERDFALVVDPVCVAQGGAKLLRDDAVAAMIEMIFPLADLVTPNLFEAELFAGREITCREDVFAAIEAILDRGPAAVLIKGGHFDSPVVTDWLGVRGGRPVPLMHQRVDTRNLHGTGCTLSAAIATGLGQGLDLIPAVVRAQKFLNLGLRAGWDLGRGSGPVNHSAPLIKDRARVGVLEDLERAGEALSALEGLARLIPEARLNLALALPFADGPEEVAAFSGRVTCTEQGRVLVAGGPRFGASTHLARVLLSARRVLPGLTCVANIRHDAEILRAARACKLEEAWFDRAEEPRHAKEMEGSTLDWGTYQALDSHPHPGRVDMVCDRGGPGQEPMIRIFAGSVDVLLDKLARVASALAG